MIRYLLHWLGLNTEQAIEDAPPVHLNAPAGPGTRVRGPDGVEGTITGVFPRGEQTIARVVFTGPRASWVALVATDRLQAA